MFEILIDFIVGIFRGIYNVFDISFMGFPSLSLLIVFCVCLFIVLGFLFNK